MPSQKVEAVMRQALAPNHSDLKIDREARALMQVAVTEFICFITSDVIDEISSEKRVAIKEQDLIESIEKMGFKPYVRVLETLMRKLSDCASAASLGESYRQFVRNRALQEQKERELKQR